MSDLRDEHLERSISLFDKRDPELAKELREKIASKLLKRTESLASFLRKQFLPSEVEGATTEAAPRRAMPFEGREEETIVRQNARPVMVIRDNRATDEFIGPDSAVWANRVSAAQNVLDAVIPSIGRVEVNNNPDYQWLGTGWLVADDVIVTNRHVAREFGRLGPSGFAFRLGIGGGPQSARIDFLEEFGRAKAAEFSVAAILWIAAPSEADVAFLRVERVAGGPNLPAPLKLAEQVNPDAFVATIGYPARDPRVPDQDLVRRVFGDVYDKKRLAPGQIIDVQAEEVEHDCSTLGGTSGSPVICLSTGEVVGLHFSGTFLKANYAVAAPKLKDLFGRLQRKELPGMGTPSLGQNHSLSTASERHRVPPSSLPAPPASDGQGTFSIRLNIPIEITVRIGDGTAPTRVIASSGADMSRAAPKDTGMDLDEAVRAARSALAGRPDVLEVRAGHRFKHGWITGERVVVVEVRKKMSFAELAASDTPAIPLQFGGVGVDVRTAALADQLEALGLNLEVLEAPRRAGSYREPLNLSLDRVNERMRAVFHVSPDSGFPNLKKFLGRVRQHLTATMYEWEPNHVSDAIAAAMDGPGRALRMVTQLAGTKEAVADMRHRLGSKMEHVWASVGAGRLIPSAYHIKVASRDGEEVWLSSGNWKDSNQPDIDPAGEDSTRIGPLRGHNREWHAILENEKLATMFQRYIEWDFLEAQRVPLEEMLAPALPDLFVADEAFAEIAEAPLRATYFDPLELDRELDIQPLLTPDRDSRGNRIFMATAVEMVHRAQRSLFVQNQSFNLLAENVEEFEEFFAALRDRQQAGVDVRVIFRDPREFGTSGGAKLQKMLETISDFGIDTDQIKVQRRCHTKGLIVDDQEVLLGSHNLTNEGGLFNRDASLLVRDREVAGYFKKIFEFDWSTLAVQEADELVADVRIAQPGEATPPGFRRVSLREAIGQN